MTVAAGTLVAGGTITTPALRNAGKIQVQGTLTAGSFSNTGTVVNTGEISLSGTIASSSLNGMGGRGDLTVNGVVTNTGGTLDGTTFSQQYIFCLGTVIGGTVANFGSFGLNIAGFDRPAATTLEGVTRI